jgi:hypothetical protein
VALSAAVSLRSAQNTATFVRIGLDVVHLFNQGVSVACTRACTHSRKHTIADVCSHPPAPDVCSTMGSMTGPHPPPGPQTVAATASLAFCAQMSSWRPGTMTATLGGWCCKVTAHLSCIIKRCIFMIYYVNYVMTSKLHQQHATLNVRHACIAAQHATRACCFGHHNRARCCSC